MRAPAARVRLVNHGVAAAMLGVALLAPLRGPLLAVDAGVGGAAPNQGQRAPVGMPAPQPIIVVDPPVQVSGADADRPMGEVLIEAHPTDAMRLLTCAMTYASDENRVWVSAYLSEDRGRTWRRVLQTRGDERRSEGDPACTFGRDGQAYLAAMSNPSAGSFGGEQRLFVFRSLDGGASWSRSMDIVTTGMGFDREFLVVDNTGGPRDGTLYMNAMAGPPADTPAPKGVGLWISRDRGMTFIQPLFAPPPAADRTMLHRANAVVLSDGDLVFLVGNRLPRPLQQAGSYENAVKTAPPPDGELRLAFASDGARALELGPSLADAYMSVPLGFGAQMPWLAVDPGSPRFTDQLYVVWSDARSGRSEILLTRSSDKGRTWSAPIYVNDDHGTTVAPGGGEHSLPVVAVTRRGIVGVMWYDRRALTDIFGWEVRFAASLDGGRTFLPSVRLSTAPSGFAPTVRLNTFAYVDERLDTRRGHGLQLLIQGRQYFAGDTAGLTVDADGTFHPAWIDHATGVPQVWTTTVRIAGDVVREPPEATTLVDVSGAVRIEVLATSFDRVSGDATLTLALRNRSTEALPLPLTLRVQRMGSQIADHARAVNADNGLTSLDAQWVVGGLGAETSLQPGAATAPRELRFHLADAQPYRTATGYPDGLVSMHLRILAAQR